MGIYPTTLPQIDKYALARVLQKNPKSKAMYAKIIHKQHQNGIAKVNMKNVYFRCQDITTSCKEALTRSNYDNALAICIVIFCRVLQQFSF